MQGHAAYYTGNLVVSGASPAPHISDDYPNLVVGTTVPVGDPAIGWQDASGAWIVVDGSENRAELLQVANDARTSPGEVTAPYHLGYVPQGLSGTYAVIDDGQGVPANQNSAIGIGGAAAWTGDVHPYPNTPLVIQALPIDPPFGIGPTHQIGEPTRIGNYDTWYYTASNSVALLRAGASVMVIETGDCRIEIGARDRQQIPLSDLTRMVQNMRVTKCSDPRTWVPPLS